MLSQENPYEFFCEPELHAKFYSLCRDKFPTFDTPDGKRVAAFRSQYDTVWRYQAGDRFAERPPGTAALSRPRLRGTPPKLHQSFVLPNGPGTRMSDFGWSTRLQPEQEPRYKSEPVQAGHRAEASGHVQNLLEVSEGQVNRLEDRLLASCCKLAQERVGHAYIIGLSHGPLPDTRGPVAWSSVACRRTRPATLQGRSPSVWRHPANASWAETGARNVEFPKVTESEDWAVVKQEDLASRMKAFMEY